MEKHGRHSEHQPEYRQWHSCKNSLYKISIHKAGKEIENKQLSFKRNKSQRDRSLILPMLTRSVALQGA